MSGTTRVDLLNDVAVTGAFQKWPGGKGTLFLRGTIGGATIALETNANAGASAAVPVAVDGVSLTAEGSKNFELPPCDIRAAVTGGAPANLFAHAVSCPR